MRSIKLLVLAVLLGIWSGAAAQTYSGLYTPYAPWDTRIQHSGTVMLMDANGAVIGVLTLRSLFDSPITAVFPPVGAATTGTKVRVVFNAVGTTNGVANLQSSCTTDYTLTPPADPTPAGMSPKLVYTSRSLNPTLVITAEAPAVVDTTPPVVSITAPGAGATFVGTNALTVTASDNVGVVGVQFQIDSTLFSAEITAPPYTTIWNSTTVADGAHTISAVARDAAGNRATSAAISVKVSNAPIPPPPDMTPPSVSITSPVAGATVSGIVNLTANATDNVGVVGVQFGLDGANLGAEDTTAPYSITWVTTSVADGTHTLNAVARDAAGNRASSALVTVTVANASPPPPATGESPDGSTIPPLAQIVQVNAAGTVFTWKQVGTHATVNGADSGGSGFDQILYKAKIIYAHQSGDGWWRWTGGSWATMSGTP